MKLKIHWLLLILLIFLVCGCKETASSDTIYNRPVKVIKLQKIDPTHNLRLTGSAKAWRQESLAFEVKGRLIDVSDENTDVDIFHTPRQDGAFDIVGEEVAALETSRYDADVRMAKAQFDAATSEANAIEIDINRLTPQDIRSAEEQISALKVTLEQVLRNELTRVESQLTLAKQEYGRAKELYERNAGTKQSFDQAQNQLDSAQSVYNQVKGNIIAKEKELASAQALLEKLQASIQSKVSQLKVAQAGIQRAKAQLDVATRNLDDCILRTPFSGVISSRLVTRGAVIGAGQPVVVVTMMDPIHIEVSVSAEMARNIQPGDPVLLYPSTINGEAVKGLVEKKSVVADPGTRTYKISCMGRNRILTPRGGEYQENKKPLKKSDIAMVWDCNSRKSLMIWTRSILKDQQGYYAWALKKVKLGDEKLRPQKCIVQRVRFELGDKCQSFVEKDYREILNAKDLEVKMVTLRSDFPNLTDGLEVEYLPMDWMIRPGDLVQVLFDLDEYPPGVYAPVSAIMSDDQGHYIFLHQQNKARKLAVTVHQTFREYRRIEAKESLENQEIITMGAHYLKDQDPVIASRQEVQQ